MSTEFSDLPSEIVQHILSFVPSRHQAALACKYFYEQVCLLENDCYKLSINSKVHISENNTKYIDEMMLSKRKIKEITLSQTDTNTERINSVFKKFGDNVKTLNLYNCTINENELARWFNMMPLLEQIKFEKTRIDNPSDGIVLSYNLQHLQKLTFKDFHFDKNTQFIKAIPRLKALSWNIVYLHRTEITCRGQFNIKNMKLSSDLETQNLLSHVSPSEMTSDNDFDAINCVFSQQQNLTSLTLQKFPLNIDLFNTICNMKSLEYLNFTAERLLPSSLVNIEHMTNLKSLIVNDGKKEHLDVITELNLPGLELIGLVMFPNLLDFSKNMKGYKNIKKIQLSPIYRLETLEMLIKQFPKLEFIKVAMADGTTVDYYKPDHSLDFTNMKKLFIGVSPIIPDFLEVLPFINSCLNLEEITLYIPQDISVIPFLLHKHKKLRKLSVLMNARSSNSPSLDYSIVEFFESNASRLVALMLRFEIMERTWNSPLDIDFIKKRLSDRFPIITKEFLNGSHYLIIKKRGEELEAWK